MNDEETIVVEQISDEEAKIFLLEYEDSKSTESKTYNLGLFSNDQLLGIVQFCAPRSELTKNKYTREVLNICFKEGIEITKGFSKIINHYMEVKNPSDFFILNSSVKDIEVVRIPELNWNNVDTSDGSILEWRNLKKTHYVYKTTALDSNKYYFGVSHVMKNAAIEKDCLNHDYFGTGSPKNFSNKFNRWKNKHKNFLQKEIVGIFDWEAEAYSLEKKLIGKKWKKDSEEFDPLILNSCDGGKSGGLKRELTNNANIKKCDFHGLTKHQGSLCRRCLTSKNITYQNCEEHGISKFQFNTCHKCSMSNSIALKTCSRHGEAKHQNDGCYDCRIENMINLKECSKHGLTSFRGNSCYKCFISKRDYEKICEKEPLKHGLSKHMGETCYKCKNSKIISLKNCKKHGMVKHQGDLCRKCKSSESFNFKICKKDSTHGRTKHLGETCCKCQSQKSNTIKLCKDKPSIHGETNHRGSACQKCASEKSYSLKYCEIHGESKHQGTTCAKCRSAKIKSVN